jgi:hypothetical protein
VICTHCNAELPATALFCGMCGRSLAVTGRLALAAAAAAVPAPEPEVEVEPEPEPEPEAEPEIDAKTVVSRAKRAKKREDVPVAPEPEPEPQPEPRERDPWSSPVAASTPLVVQPAPQQPAGDPWRPPAALLRTSSRHLDEDVEKTRIVSPAVAELRFVLQFSTGESVSVTGTGLVGRNPRPEPTEYFDHLIAIVDPGKSVSKTHVEFGQAAGMFWVSDRYSGNGTVIREPDSAPRRCEPGKRYRIERGTRVMIGEQFFIVS